MNLTMMMMTPATDNQGRQLAGAEPVPKNQQGDRDTNPLLDDGILPENQEVPELKSSTQDTPEPRSTPRDSTKDKRSLPNKKASSRPQRTRKPYDPKAFDKSKAPMAIVYVAQLSETATYHEAMTGPNRREWRGATDEELEALWRKGTFIIVLKPKGRQLISSK